MNYKGECTRGLTATEVQDLIDESAGGGGTNPEIKWQGAYFHDRLVDNTTVDTDIINNNWRTIVPAGTNQTGFPNNSYEFTQSTDESGAPVWTYTGAETKRFIAIANVSVQSLQASYKIELAFYKNYIAQGYSRIEVSVDQTQNVFPRNASWQSTVELSQGDTLAPCVRVTTTPLNGDIRFKSWQVTCFEYGTQPDTAP